MINIKTSKPFSLAFALSNYRVEWFNRKSMLLPSNTRIRSTDSNCFVLSGLYRMCRVWRKFISIDIIYFIGWNWAHAIVQIVLWIDIYTCLYYIITICVIKSNDKLTYLICQNDMSRKMSTNIWSEWIPSNVEHRTLVQTMRKRTWFRSISNCDPIPKNTVSITVYQ